MTEVIIATPVLDGKIEVRYVDSLLRTIDEAKKQDIKVYSLFLSDEAMVQRARNSLYDLLIKSNKDIVVFIDSDIYWEPVDFMKLLSHREEIVSGIYKKKNDKEESYVYPGQPVSISSNCLIHMDKGIGIGFFKITRKPLQDIWNQSQEYLDNDGTIKRAVFKVEVRNGSMYGEDINFCLDLEKLGYKVWLDPTIKLKHIGRKEYEGDFVKWANKTGRI